MKALKKILLSIVVLSILIFCIRGFLFRNLITYQSIGTRQAYAANQDFIKYIDKNSENKKVVDIREIIKLALKLTTHRLNFTFDKCDTNPNLLLKSKQTNCIGYAAYFSTTCNYLFKKYQISGVWTATTQIGQLNLLGINIHNYTNSSFFKDHDFVKIENKKTGEIFAVDPSVCDYFYIDFVTFKK